MTKLLTFLKTVPVQLYVVAGCVMAVLGAVTAYNANQRSIGAAHALAAVALQRADSLETELVGARRALHVDTVKLVKRLVQSDTVLQTLIDTAHVYHTDTVKVPVRVLVQADSDLKSCRAVIAECGKVATMEKARADAIQQAFANYQKAQPSRLMPHIGAGISAGVDVKGKPNAVGGIIFGWTFW